MSSTRRKAELKELTLRSGPEIAVADAEWQQFKAWRGCQVLLTSAEGRGPLAIVSAREWMLFCRHQQSLREQQPHPAVVNQRRERRVSQCDFCGAELRCRVSLFGQETVACLACYNQGAKADRGVARHLESGQEGAFDHEGFERARSHAAEQKALADGPWTAIRQIRPAAELERKYGLPEGSLTANSQETELPAADAPKKIVWRQYT